MIVRAAMLTPNLSMGGAERWIVSLIKHSDPSQLQWTGVALGAYGGIHPGLCRELAQHVPVFGAEIARVPARPTPAELSPDCPDVVRSGTVIDALQKAAKGADVIVTWGGYNFRNIRQAIGDTPLVCVSHSSHHPPISFKHSGVTHLAAVSHAACRPFQHRDNPPSHVVYNGAETSRVKSLLSRQQQRSIWGVTDSDLVIGYLGRFANEKNPLAPTDAVLRLGEPWVAVYYGSCPPGQFSPVRQMQAAKSQCSPRVIFCEPTLDVGSVYNALDVVMLASHSEAFSVTLIEAWLAGCAVVGTPVGCVPELEQQYGQLIQRVPLKPTPQQLAEACVAAVSPEFAVVRERASKLAYAMFTAEHMAASWAAYLAGIKIKHRKLELDL